MLSRGTEQTLHRLLSAGLHLVIEDTNPEAAFDAIHYPNHRDAGLQLWFATDLDLAIGSAAIPPEVKNSDDAKLVIRQGVMSTSCGWLWPLRLANRTHLKTGRCCTDDTRLLYNNTSKPIYTLQIGRKLKFSF